ncbi:MAG: hypothetical protein UU72_C0028G0001 [candidate division WWE3 bacterium GW2011_GWB1_41_6]|uniref:Uncharacterized protein n=1 Tax=candidate division WWE3 bacterium GW2011_GWB1_41_6 TaxID=1619112 RepID=A0A0G0WTI4_UNCKA|nr:MAG: hypothetical protein UU72_C0028G0001 [candidate division WWE3 bacterium GW2011_GWB1_41_6]
MSLESIPSNESSEITPEVVASHFLDTLQIQETSGVRESERTSLDIAWEQTTRWMKEQEQNH